MPAVTDTVVSDSSSSGMPPTRLEGYREDAEVLETRRTITLQAQLKKQPNSNASTQLRADWGHSLQGALTTGQGSRYAEIAPHPREFIVGHEATFFENADPTEDELLEFFTFRKTADWRHYTKSLQRAGSDVLSFKLEGRDDVIQFREWEKRIRYQFDSWVLTNPVVRAELAMTTFVYTAQDWWGAHRLRNPSLRVTFSQLCEWLTTELVPSASHASALEAWTCLEYRNDLEWYFKQLDDLRFYHHIDPCAAHSIAAKPFGTEFQARIRIMDKEAGIGGIAFPTLKELIRAHCAERPPLTQHERAPDSRRRNDGARNGVQARAVTVEPNERNNVPPAFSAHRGKRPGWRVSQPNSIPMPQRSPFETRDYFCLVCGDKNHIWTQCPHKQPRGCAACGSEAHLVRSCAQRWKGSTAGPHRWDQTPETQEKESPGGCLQSEKTTEQKDGLAARRVGVYSSLKNRVGPTQPTRTMCIAGNAAQTKANGERERSRVGFSQGLPQQEVFIDPQAGVAPQRAERIQGELLYPIEMNGVPASALWDPGAGASFISSQKVSELRLTPKPLSQPLRLEVWDGPGTVITHQAVVDKVKFGNKEGKWSFMIDPHPPHEIVLGIDVSRAWHLTVNPNNDRLVCVAPLGPSCAKRHEKAWWDEREPEDSSVPENGVNAGSGHLREWEESVRVKTYFCSSRLEKETLTIGEETDNVFVVARHLHSVTACTPEEEEKKQELIEAMDPEVAALTRQFPRLFQPPDSVPPERAVKQHITLKPNALPIRRAPYIVGEDKVRSMREQVQQLQKQGWIEPSMAPWGSPVLFVPKKEKVFRMCGDFRDLNALTLDDSFPLPRVELILHRAGGATIFSTLDLASGFHQIALTEESKPFTTFCLPEPVAGNSLWRWTVMPFGLKNAPPTFQRAMSFALKGCEDFSAVYIDDILIFSRTRADHLKHLQRVFECLDQDSYHVRLQKCLFLQEEVEFLGHRLTEKGLQASPNKIEALQAWQPPFQKAKHVKQFLGSVLWYKSFIPHMATIAAPLFPLTSSTKRFEWSEAATAAVRTLQKLVSQAPCLARWDPALSTRVVTDASKVGIGAVLEQEHDTGWRPVAFWSRRLKDPETRYHTTDREWLAVVEAVTRRWKGFLEGRPFMLCSDHMALQRKLTKSAQDPPVTDRQSRWIEALMPFALTFEYIKGKDNTVADALSRCPVSARSVTVVQSVQFGFLGWMRLAAQHDPDYQRSLLEAEKDVTKGENVQGLLRLPDGRWVVPRDDALRTSLLAEAHDSVASGHFGQLKTFKLISQYWFWPSIQEDVREYVQTCVRCQKVKSSTHKAPGLLYPLSVSRPGHTITLDYVSKFTPAEKTQHDQCLVMVDKFSKFVMLKGCRESISAEETARLFHEKVFPLFGAPRVVLSDRGPQFSARFWREIMSLMQTKVAIATSHHPQTDGQSERTIQTLLRLIRTYASQNQKQWEAHLPMFEVALNSVAHASTGLPPHQVLFGQEARVPSTFLEEELRSGLPKAGEEFVPTSLKLRRWLQRCQDVWRLVHDNQKAADEKAKERYDKNRKAVHFEVGSLVLLSTSSHAALTGVRKHRERFVGPYLVEGAVHPNAYKLKGLPPGVPTTQNVRYLRAFKPSPSRFLSRPTPEYATPVEVDGHWEWEVEAIVGHRQLRQGFKYRVKWKDTPQEQWLPASALRHCRHLLTDYHRARNLPLPAGSLDDRAEDEEQEAFHKMTDPGA